MGAGPVRLLADPEIPAGLRAEGWVVESKTIETPEASDPEIVHIARANRSLARVVRAAVAEGAFPLVLAGNCNSLRERRPRIYLHVDPDVLDPSEGRANRFAADGGLTVAELEAALELAFEAFQVGAAAITAYDPALDADGRMAAAASRVIRTIGREALGR